MFINHGKCSEYAKNGVVPTYDDRERGQWPAIEIYYINYWNKTCANGWGFGNIAVSAKDAATFWYEYLGTENIISDKSKEVLFHWGAPTKYVTMEYRYGGGLEKKSAFMKKGQDGNKFPKAGIIYGHSGMNYASETMLAGFNQQFNYSLVLSINALEGASCQELTLFDSRKAEQMLQCLIQDLTIQFFTQG